jgi:flagellar basal-body rod protein FlgC
VTASNLANAQTTRTPEGGAYRRRDPVFQSVPVGDRFHDLMNERLARASQGVETVEIVEDTAPPRLVHDPSHPDANPDGFVEYPNIEMVEEMVNMIMASRAYDAGVTAMQSVSGMARSALRIGG